MYTMELIHIQQATIGDGAVNAVILTVDTAKHIASLNILHRGTHGKCLQANTHWSVEQEASPLKVG